MSFIFLIYFFNILIVFFFLGGGVPLCYGELLHRADFKAKKRVGGGGTVYLIAIIIPAGR